MVATHHTFQDDFTLEERRSVLIKQVMSDDEDLESIQCSNGKVLTSLYRRKIPTWRSDKVSQTYCLLLLYINLLPTAEYVYG